MSEAQKLILIVEDEPSLAQILGEYLARSGFAHHWLENGLDVVPWVKQAEPDLVILDLMLPGIDGIEVFRQLRTFCDIPVIMATARVDEIDRLLGLELGADDYVCKPYSPREVIARVKNILRRSVAAGQDSEADDLLTVDAERMQAHVRGRLLDLTPVEFRLLHHLYANQGKVFSRNQLLNQLYDDHRIVTDRAVDSHIKNLRKKLHGALPEREVIKSVYGVGYKLEL